MSSGQDVSYAYPGIIDKAIGAWFLGPKFENHAVFEEQVRKIVRYFKHGRDTYFPNDAPFITKDIMQSQDYKTSVDKLDQVVEYLSILLAHHSVPISSPRYAAHVVGDTSLPAVVGYILGMLYNQNNVSPEISPLTGAIEYVVGQDLCRMLGFATIADKKGRENDPEIVGWGHVTCDGSVANYESMWVARSIKFYPLSLLLAITEGNLKFVSSTFSVKTTGSGGEKLYVRCSSWELLNLKQNVILGLAAKLTEKFGISLDYIEQSMKPYLAQTMGKDELERRFKIKSPKYFVSITKHYSINKGANILGIGEGNLVDIDIDNHARMDTKDLFKKLEQCIEERIAVYGVLSIMGTTEHGAVDPLDEILHIRDKLEADRGVSFLVHCDAAWGGYFTSILRDPPKHWDGPNPDSGFIQKPLLPYTKTQLDAMRHADTVTIDSHKSGYCPYPAGGLCYRDDRMRYLITTTSPYINTTGEGVEAMGTYGLEGSKPGASPLAVWVSNMVLGLHTGGYGSLLSQAILTGVRYYTLWLNVSRKSKLLYVTPFVMLPVEENANHDSKLVDKEKARLMECILRPSCKDVIQDKDTMDTIRTIGSDLMINTFSCNFMLSNGEFNKDVTEANFLNQRIYERLSIRMVTDDINQKPLILVGTIWEQALYKQCLTKFKERLHLDPRDPTDLHAFSNVAMSPFVTDNLMGTVGEAFLTIAEEEARNCQERVEIKPAYHGFIMQGTDRLYLVYLPMLHVGRHRQQLIVTGKLPKEAMSIYIKWKEAKPSATFTLHTSDRVLLQNILDSGCCDVDLTQDLPHLHGVTHRNRLTRVKLTEITVVKHHSLAPRLLSRDYPPSMLFYIYGTARQMHVDHVLLKAPNAQLTSSQVQLAQPPSDEHLARGLIAVLDDIHEAAMQPFSDKHIPAFFRAEATFKVTIYVDPYQYDKSPNIDIHGLWTKLQESKPISTGQLVLGKEAFVDVVHINQETVPEVDIIYHGRELSVPSSLPIPEEELPSSLLTSLKTLMEKPEISLSRDIENAVLSSNLAVGDYRLAPRNKDVPNAISVSRYLMGQPTDPMARKVGLRQQWRDAFSVVGGR